MKEKLVDTHLLQLDELIADKANLNIIDEDGRTLLIRAIVIEDIISIDKLITAGVDVNIGDKDGRTPLMYAIFTGNSDVVGKILVAGANVHEKDNSGRSVAFAALGAHRTNTYIFELLFRKGLNANERYIDGNTLLIKYGYKYGYYFSEIFITYGADVNALNDEGKNALYFLSHDAVKAQILLKNGSDIIYKDILGNPIIYSAELEKLIQDQRSLIIKNIEGKINEIKQYRYLYSKDIAEMINQIKSTNLNELDIEVLKEKIRTLNKLIGERRIKTGQVLTIFNVDMNILMHGIEDNDLTIVKYFLEKGAKLNYGYALKVPIIHRAVKSDLEIFKLVVDSSEACLNYRDKEGRTPVICTIEEQRYNHAAYLIEKGVDLSITNISGETVVELAAAKERLSSLVYAVLKNQNAIRNLTEALFYSSVPYESLKEGITVIMNSNNSILLDKYKDNILDLMLDAYIYEDEDFIWILQNRFKLTIPQVPINQYQSAIYSRLGYRTLVERNNGVISSLLVNIVMDMYSKYGYNLEDNQLELLKIAVQIGHMKNSQVIKKYAEYYFINILKLSKVEASELIAIITCAKPSTLKEKIISDIINLANIDKNDFKFEEIFFHSEIARYNKEAQTEFAKLLNEIRYFKQKIQYKNKYNDILDLLKSESSSFKILRIELTPNKKENIKTEDTPQSKIERIKDDGYILFRCIYNPSLRNSSSIDNHTNFQTELVKLSRKPGQPTFTKPQGIKLGNPKRSTTMVNYGSKLLGHMNNCWNAGYIIYITDTDTSNVVSVSLKNKVSGRGKKAEKNLYENEEEPELQNLATIQEKMNYLKNVWLAAGNGQKCNNEVQININGTEVLEGFFYATENNEDLSKLDGIYIQWEFEQYTGKKLPIYKYSTTIPCPLWEEYKAEDIADLIKTVYIKYPEHILNKGMLRIIECFSMYIKADSQFLNKTLEFLDTQTPLDIFEFINISRAFSALDESIKADKVLIEGMSKFLDKYKVVESLKELMRIKDVALNTTKEKGLKRPDSRVVEFFEVLDYIKSMMSVLEFYRMKLLIREALTALYEYESKINNLKAVEKVVLEWDKHCYMWSIPQSIKDMAYNINIDILKLSKSKEYTYQMLKIKEMDKHAKWAAKNYYRKPYSKKNISPDIYIERHIHGVTHACRAAILVPIVYGLYKKYNYSKDMDLTPEELSLTMIAALLHDSGRGGEGEDIWERESAENCFIYLVDELGVNREIAILIAEAIMNKDVFPNDGKLYRKMKVFDEGVITWTEEPAYKRSKFQKLLHDADCIEINRCISAEMFNVQQLDIHKDIGSQAKEDIDELIKQHREFIKLTGDEYQNQDASVRIRFENAENGYIEILNQFKSSNLELLKNMYENAIAINLKIKNAECQII